MPSTEGGGAAPVEFQVRVLIFYIDARYISRVCEYFFGVKQASSRRGRQESNGV